MGVEVRVLCNERVGGKNLRMKRDALELDGQQQV